jgi:hypothetical protein
MAPQHPRSLWTRPSRQLLLLQQQPWGVRGKMLHSSLLCSALLCFELCMAPAQGPLDRLPLMSIYTESNSDNGPKIVSI